MIISIMRRGDIPRSKRVVDSYGMIVVYEQITKTHWAQMVGESLVRCDDAAKKTGRGTWVVQGPGIHWGGVWEGAEPANLAMGARVDPTLWIRDEWSKTSEYEKDVS
jgi:hypothetical protein